MRLFPLDISVGLELASRVDPKYAPVWQGRPDSERAALAMYFLPHKSAKEVLGVTRPRLIKWYCPFADQRAFPSGHRYCINVYTGCSHKCEYCYAAAYEPDQPKCKANFERMLLRDLDDLDAFDLPPAPLHLSNSTDAFQPLEKQVGQTRLALQHIARCRRRFTTVTVLTKNPLLAAEADYVELLQSLVTLPADHLRAGEWQAAGFSGVRVEVSVAFWRDDVREQFDPAAPPIEARLEGIRRLCNAGVPVVMRIDPLMPRDLVGSKRMSDFGLPQPQSLDDLDHLLAFAAEVGIMHIVYSVAKIPRQRAGGLSDTMGKLLEVYRHIAGPQSLVFRGGSWRLPDEIARQKVVQPFLSLCRKHNLTAKFCVQNLISTP